MTFAQFIAHLAKRRFPTSAWVDEPGLSLYVRKAIRSGVDFDLANMNAHRPGRGALTHFLDKWEDKYAFHVECVHNPRLVAYLERRGYKRLPDIEGAPCMVLTRRDAVD